LFLMWSIAREPLYGGVRIGESGGGAPLLCRPWFDEVDAIALMLC
jgi:hypothetical protein